MRLSLLLLLLLALIPGQHYSVQFAAKVRAQPGRKLHSSKAPSHLQRGGRMTIVPSLLQFWTLVQLCWPQSRRKRITKQFPAVVLQKEVMPSRQLPPMILGQHYSMPLKQRRMPMGSLLIIRMLHRLNWLVSLTEIYAAEAKETPSHRRIKMVAIPQSRLSRVTERLAQIR